MIVRVSRGFPEYHSMSLEVYLNGKFLPEGEAKISIFDRATLFGDAVYEVAAVLESRLVNLSHHLSRLERSLAEISIPCPVARDDLLALIRELVARNGLREGLVYMQVTRGVAERNYICPENLTPTFFMFTQQKNILGNEHSSSGIALKVFPDIRWSRRDIKSVNLLGQVLAKQAAHSAGAFEALLVEPDNHVTECGSTSFFICRDRKIITRPLSHDILPGVTRKALLSLCKTNRVAMEERRFTLEEALEAEEAFISSASSFVIPVTHIDDCPIGNSQPGPVTLAMQELYIAHARSSAI